MEQKPKSEMITVPEVIGLPSPEPRQEIRVGVNIPMTTEQAAKLSPTAVNRMAEQAAFAAPTPDAANVARAEVQKAFIDAQAQVAAGNINGDTPKAA